VYSLNRFSFHLGQRLSSLGMIHTPWVHKSRLRCLFFL
jgi:hypothetical protein